MSLPAIIYFLIVRPIVVLFIVIGIFKSVKYVKD